MDKLDQMAETVAAALRGFVVRSVGALAQRVEAIEARQPEKGEPGLRGEKGDAGPAGIQGKDGVQGLAGKDANPEFIRTQVAEAVKAIPPARDGRDGKNADPVDVDAIVKTVVAVIPEPPPGRDGRDGAPGIVGQKGEDGRNGVDGRDGFSLDDFEIALADDGRTLSFKFAHGEFIKERTVRLQTMVYKGIWRQGEFDRGDTATFAGSLWHCEKDGTTEKPGNGTGAWKLCAKRGNDGKDAPAPTE